MNDDDPVGRIMDKAQGSDRQALFAALQAAVGVMIDAKYRGFPDDGFARVEKALDIGAPYGSPEQIASMEEAS